MTNNELLTYKSIFESHPGLLLVLSPDFQIQAATNAYLLEAQIKRSSIEGKYLLDIFPDNPEVPEASSTTLKYSVERVLATGEPHKMEVFRYDTPDPNHPGKFLERYWLTTNTPVLTDAGIVCNIIHETVNVTESIKADAQIKDSAVREKEAWAIAEQQRIRLERLFSQAPAAMAILEGPELVFRVLNNAYQQLFPGRALIELALFDALPELKDQPIAGIIRDVYQTGETFEAQELLVPMSRTHNGPIEDIYWSFIYQALLDANGKVNGVLIFALDVTNFVEARRQIEKSAAELKNLNQELENRVSQRTTELQSAQADAQRQRERLENLFMNAPAPICILNGPDLVYELVNPSYEKLFPGRKLLGKPILEVLPEIADNYVYTTFRQVYETGITHEEPELHIPLARPEDGHLEDRYFRYIQQPRKNEADQIDGIMVYAFEITEQVRARQTVDALNRDLLTINADLDNFVYVASHDLKTPISNIESLIMTLSDELEEEIVDTEIIQQVINLMQDSVNRFKQTITDLAKVAEAQKGIPEDIALVQIPKVVEEVLLDQAFPIKETQAFIHTDYAPDSRIHFSAKNLRSIVYNLISNALKYRSPERPLSIKITTQFMPGYLILSVSDNGLGMEVAENNLIFKMFKRLHDHVEGSGVGLYIVNKLVENAGGKIIVNSELGLGSTFEVYFKV